MKTYSYFPELIIVGLLIFSLSGLIYVTKQAESYNKTLSEELLEEIRDNGDEIISKLDTLIDRH